MKIKKSSVVLGTLGLVTALAFSTASAQEPGTDAGADAAKKVRAGLSKVATAEQPVAGTPGPDGNVWIAEKGGTVRVLGDQGLGQPVLDISGDVSGGGERGLLGVTFDPGFEHFYVSFTDRQGTSTIDEFAMEGDEIQQDTRRTVITQEQPYPNHNGGHIAFGSDGMLYIGLGDGGSAGDPQDNGQNLNTLLGALLRIDPSGGEDGAPYAIPADNPFVDDPNARDEIWAYGLRNPWRFSFDSGTGDLLIGDVGQDTREEIDWAPADSPGGENYGWARMEGTLNFSGEEPANHVPPVHEYDRGGVRCSVTGGYVYRGDAIPGLQGRYLYSDYCDGEIRALTMRDGEVTGDRKLGLNAGNVASFVEGGDQELYVLDLQGSIYRLDPVRHRA